MTPAEAIAVAIGDHWWAVCEDPQTFAKSTPAQQRTFTAMAAAMLDAGRRGERSIDQIARALCEGFSRDAAAEGVQPRAWASLGEMQRTFFRQVAERAIQSAQRLRAARDYHHGRTSENFVVGGVA